MQLNWPPQPTEDSTTPSRRPGLLVPMVVLLLAAVLVVGFYFSRGRHGQTVPTATQPDKEQAAATVMVDVKLRRDDQARSNAERLTEKFDTRLDSWKTEVLNDVINKQLKTLTRFIEHPESIVDENITGLAADDFTCETLRPSELVQVYRHGPLAVSRWESPDDLTPPPADGQRGHRRLAAVLRGLVAPLGSGSDIRAKLNQFNITIGDTHIETRLFYEASNRQGNHGIQQNATWRLTWTPAADNSDDEPRLMSIHLERYEQIDITAPSGALFADCTESAMAANTNYRSQVLPGLNHWLPRITRMLKMSFLGHHSVAVADVNGDGLEDVYVCEAGGLPNQLYLQNLDGTVTEAAAQAGVNWLDATTSALLIDIDGDGDQDLFVAGGQLLVAENDGQGRFTLRSKYSAMIDEASLAAADYDQDGDLDVYICAYRADPLSHTPTPPIPYHDANNGGASVLMRNNGNFQFEDVTDAVGLNHNNTRFSFAAVWEDYDNDGDQDLYVANDFGRNCLYRNDGGHFQDVAPQAGVEDIATGMSVTWGDYNRDGLMDLYVSNMWSGAGNRIVYQRQFAPGATNSDVRGLQRTTRGNSLFANLGGGRFQDVSVPTDVTMGRWAWASKFTDFNNDGWQDLLVTNGYITNEDTDDL